MQQFQGIRQDIINVLRYNIYKECTLLNYEFHGDIIQKLGDFDVNGVEDYMVGLGKLTADKPTTVIVLRGAETLTFPIQFQ